MLPPCSLVVVLSCLLRDRFFYISGFSFVWSSFFSTLTAVGCGPLVSSPYILDSFGMVIACSAIAVDLLTSAVPVFLH